MKKTYTRKQIAEAISYWKKQLAEGNYRKVNESAGNLLDIYEIGEKYGFSLDDVKKIYRGTNHACRCGCLGDYSEPGEQDFDSWMDEIEEMEFSEDEIEVSTSTAGRLVCITLPFDDNWAEDQCFTLYFE